MKIKILLLTALLVGSQSCGFLEEKPDNFISPGNFYQNAADAEAAVNAAYDALSEWGTFEREIYLMTELSTDNMDLNGRNQERVQLDDYVSDASNGIFLNAWLDHYRGINLANAVIGRVPGITGMDAALRDRIVAEGRFLRAFYYFNLVRLYGDVPLITQETTNLEGLRVTRTPVAEVYDQIIEDLTAAEEPLPVSYDGPNVGRATKGAAKALLAKVYLTMAGNPVNDQSKWQAAGDKAKEVIDLDVYQLAPNYADNFAIAKKNGPESIFEGQALANTGDNDVGRTYTNFAPMPQNEYGQRAYGGFLPTLELYNSYEPGDVRKELYLTEGYTTPAGVKVKVDRPHINKYVDPSGGENNNSNNWPYLRYADVLLMYAEAQNELGNAQEAAAYLNQVRSRAKLPDTPATTQAELREAIEKERRLELAFEGHRWFDLVRTGKLVPTMRAKGKTGIQDYHVLYPVPQRERDVNPSLTQNDGY